ncbi:hypothetical protein [Terriglobus roseus]|uniref:Uncharacterized protein n=1 Tax=Terriglobus roseus TaxID=392734 RepID=A0A1H4NT52_9BACT|nr:hypothetical protein [Terriglobus roseus]SEB97978.1 hypothetical protein SAMN05443244_2337 [Terriglobus roseus]
MPRMIQLQNPDKSLSRFIGPSELADMERRDEIHVFSKGKKGQIVARLKPRVEPLRSMYEASNTSISHADILANVGLTSRANSTAEITRSRAAATRLKIAAHDPRGGRESATAP